MEAFLCIFPKLNNDICYSLLSHDFVVYVCHKTPNHHTSAVYFNCLYHCFIRLVTFVMKMFTSLTIKWILKPEEKNLKSGIAKTKEC